MAPSACTPYPERAVDVPRTPDGEHGPNDRAGQEAAGPGSAVSGRTSSDDPAGIRAALRRGEPAERAAELIAARPAPGLEAELVEALGDPDPRVRAVAVRALGTVARSRGSRALMRAAAADLSPAVRAEAVTALGRILEARVGTEQPPPPTGRPA